MSDETNQGSGAPKAPADDQLTNVKAEFNRKLTNFEQKVSSLEETQRALLDVLKQNKLSSQESQAPSRKIDDIWFDKPGEAAAMIKEQTKAELKREMELQASLQARTNSTIGKLTSEFPELADGDHVLTKRAVEIYNSYDADEKSSPASYKAAVREAAQELDIMPRSKRPDSDDYSVSGSGSNASRSSSRKERGNIDAATLQFAEIMGLDTSDPTVKERLKMGYNRPRGYSQWTSAESPKKRK